MLALIFAASFAWNVQAVEPSGVRTSEAPFESIALSWSASSDSQAVPRLRVSADGLTWSDWVTAQIDGDVTSREDGKFATAITHFGGTNRYIEYAFSDHVHSVTLTMFAPPGKSQQRHVLEGFMLGPLSIRARLDWGCPDGEGSRWTPAYSDVTHAVVHHTAGANELPDWDAEVRAIWFFHTVTNGWGDIGYNFLIDPNGVIYEGRAGGDGVIGAHFSCRNTNTVGVALLGTYSTVTPTGPALDSLKRLLAELVKRDQINAAEIALHVPSGLSLPGIIGHRDGNSSSLTCTRTECPGDVVYGMLPSIRADLACTAAWIEGQPSSSTAPAILSVTARGSEPLSYQWYAGTSGYTDAPIAGATNPTLEVSPALTASYWVRVSNACGSVDSSAAIVNVASPGRRRVATH